jgi:hypothetical protein
MSIEGLVIKLSEDLLFDIIDGIALAAMAGIEHGQIKSAVLAKITDPALIPAELRRIRIEAIDRMGT